MSAHVFLSHSTPDKPVVEELARRLRDKEGIQAWLDKRDLIPGAAWQPAIEDALKECESCAVFVGPEELRALANRRDASGDQSPGLRQRATIPGHSGFAARGEARELAGVARKHYVGRILWLNR